MNPKSLSNIKSLKNYIYNNIIKIREEIFIFRKIFSIEELSFKDYELLILMYILKNIDTLKMIIVTFTNH